MILRFIELKLFHHFASLEIDDLQSVIVVRGREQALAFQIGAHVIQPPVDLPERDTPGENQYRGCFGRLPNLSRSQAWQNQQLQCGGVRETDPHLFPLPNFLDE